MNRQFSMTRRRANHVDLTIPRQSGVDGYRIQSSPNFDGAWTTLFTSTNTGFVDPAINLAVVSAQNIPSNAFGPAVRCIFDPATYSLVDTKSFWLRFVPVTAGTPGTAGAPTLVLSEAAHKGLGVVTIHGTAPLAADSTGSLQIDLPALMQDFRFHNEDATNTLFVAFEQDGAEAQCKSGTQETITTLEGNQSSIWVRSAGGAVAFSLICTRAFAR
jgi:hypothetical protein